MITAERRNRRRRKLAVGRWLVQADGFPVFRVAAAPNVEAMTPRKLTKLLLGLPEAVEEHPFGPDVDVYKVGHRIFALAQATTVSLKCDPVVAEDLRKNYAGIIPGYHLNKRHWNTVSLDGSVPDALITEMCEDSYDLVVASLPKVVRLRLHRA